MDEYKSGDIRDYVKAFSALMLEIKDMSEEDKLFHFFRGLKPWAQASAQMPEHSRRRHGTYG